MNHSKLKHLIGWRYESSIVRRSMILLGLGLPAFGAGLLTNYLAAALLPAEGFGVFYVASTLVNVLYSGSLVLNLFFTRYLVSVVQAAGQETAFAAARRVEWIVILWGSVCATAVFLVLLMIASQFGVQSRLIVLLVILDAFTAYVADLGRALLQSLRRTFMLGVYTLAWMLLRLLLCVVGILAFGTAWGALLGSVAASVIVFAGFHLGVATRARSVRTAVQPLPSPTTLLPAVLGYGLLIAVSNLDVLLSYFFLTDGDLAVYSASSVFPKAILVATTPLLQMLFPMMMGHPADRATRIIVRKSSGVVFALTVSGVAVFWLTSDWLCGGTWGLKLCQSPPLGILLLSVIPLALLRVFVLLQFARGRDWFTLWLIVPTMTYMVLAWMSVRSIATLAEGFAVFAAAVLVCLL